MLDPMISVLPATIIPFYTRAYTKPCVYDAPRWPIWYTTQMTELNAKLSSTMTTSAIENTSVRSCNSSACIERTSMC
jgi:hypothetical protein